MKSVDKPYRLSIYNVLNGHLSYNGVNVPLYDELKSGLDNAKVFVLFSTQQSQKQYVADIEARAASIDLEVICKTGSEVSKDVLDDIEDQISNLILPDNNTCMLVAPAGFEIQETAWQGSITLTTQISQTETIIRKIIKISSIITQ